MKRFTSKPSVCYAYQYDGPNSLEGDEPSVPFEGVRWIFTSANGNYKYPHVRTAQGQDVMIRRGEWIVREPDGSGHYPIKDEIFKARWKEDTDRTERIEEAICICCRGKLSEPPKPFCNWCPDPRNPSKEFHPDGGAEHREPPFKEPDSNVQVSLDFLGRNGFLKDGDNEKNGFAKRLWGVDEHVDRGNQPAMQLVISLDDHSVWLETYGRDGDTIYLLEMIPRRTVGELTSLCRELGIELN